MNVITRTIHGLFNEFQIKGLDAQEPPFDIVDLKPGTKVDITIHLLPGLSSGESRIRMVVNGIHTPNPPQHISLYNTWPTKDVLFTAKGITQLVLNRTQNDIIKRISVLMETLLDRVYIGYDNSVINLPLATPDELAKEIVYSILKDAIAFISIQNDRIVIDKKFHYTQKSFIDWSTMNTKEGNKDSKEREETEILETILKRLERLEKIVDRLDQSKSRGYS